ncbi:MAG TPA: GNAT family N-acetyltransferase [Nocardioidaceae bacterium]|nr:GNAT family N-acetyltransferase [Nocardioidaceae bacterium]
MSQWSIRPATDEDAAAVAHVLIGSRRANLGSVPPLKRSDAEVHAWVRTMLLLEREVWVVDVGRVVGVLALDAEWLDQLYLLPEYAGQGIGAALLDLAKVLRPDGFGLWVFVSNTGAQRFYERHGLVEVERTDGAGNDERVPDIHYTWVPA